MLKLLNKLLVVVLVSAVTYTYGAPSKEKSLVSHVAIYDVELLQQTELYSDASGKMELRFQETADAWVSQQSTNVILYTHFGKETYIKAVLSTWEAKNGQSFRFMLNLSDDKASAKISGNASRDAKTGVVTVNYSLPVKRRVLLDKEVLFPVQHMMRLIKAAKNMQVVDDSKVFDGTNEQSDVMDINTIMGSAAAPKKSTAKLVKTGGAQSYPVAMSVYLSSGKQNPDYRITQKILDSGIVEGMVLDFVKGKYQLKAELKSVKLL